MQPKKEHYRRKMPHFQQPGQWYMVTCILKGAIRKGALDNYSNQLEAARDWLTALKKRVLPRESPRGFGVPKSVKQNSNQEKLTSHLEEAQKAYRIALRKYRLAYEKVLNKTAYSGINLASDKNRKVIEEALMFWENKRLSNHAWCIMPNHFHWIFTVYEKEAGAPEVGVSKSNKKISDLGKSESREFEFPNSNSDQPVYLQNILHSVKLFTARRINSNENRTGQLWEHESFETTIRDDRHFVNALNYVLDNPVKAGFAHDWKNWPGTRVFP